MSDIEDVWRQQNAVLRDDVINNIMPETMALWSKKNADYEGQLMFLGKRGQFSDINRKFWKLKKALWDGQDLGFESAEEVCMDMIGHLLMTIHMLRQDDDSMAATVGRLKDDLRRALYEKPEELRPNEILRPDICPAVEDVREHYWWQPQAGDNRKWCKLCGMQKDS
jgi:hypothetical protein